MSRWSTVRAAWWSGISPRAIDAASVVIALLAALAEVAARRDDDGVLWWILVIGSVGAVSLWWRRRAPALVTAIGVLVQVVTTIPVVIAVAMTTLAARRRDRVLVVAAVACLAGFVLSAEVSDATDYNDGIASGILATALFVAAGSYVGARRDLLASLRERADKAEAERELRAQQARLEERARLAQEMHDVVAHKVSLISLHAGALEVNPEAGADHVRKGAALIRATAHEAVEDLREVLGLLRSDADPDAADRAIAPPPRLADLERIVAASRAAGVAASLSLEVPELPDHLARTAHRVVREALTNVHKHTTGAAATVVVRGAAGDGLCVEVVNGRPADGPPLLPGSGAGLRGLRERLAAARGSLDAGPTADGGWRLSAWVPWEAR